MPEVCFSLLQHLRYSILVVQGCGKTVECLALILANPAPPAVISGNVRPDGYVESR